MLSFGPMFHLNNLNQVIQYWISLKHKVRSKLLKHKESLERGGPALHDFSDVDTKIIALIDGTEVLKDAEIRMAKFLETGNHEDLEIEIEPKIEGEAHHYFNSGSQSNEVIVEVDHVAEEDPLFQNDTIGDPTPNHRTETPERPALKKIFRAPVQMSTSWLADIEGRRVAAEEKLAESAHIMAQAAMINAQATNSIATSMLKQQELMSKLIDLIGKKV